MNVTRLVCDDCNIRIEATFEVPAIARLSPEDQYFVNAFIYHHGSIKQMERLLGVSYPTVKNRLATISSKLEPVYPSMEPNPEGKSHSETLDLLSTGEISVDEAVELIQA